MFAILPIYKELDDDDIAELAKNLKLPKVHRQTFSELKSFFISQQSDPSIEMQNDNDSSPSKSISARSNT